MNTATIDQPKAEVVMSQKMYDTLTKFVGTVSMMRTAQKDFFKTKNTGKLMLAKGYEADVDAYLDDLRVVNKPGTMKLESESFNEDAIGKLILSKVKISESIILMEEGLAKSDVGSDRAAAIREQLHDMRYDLDYVNTNLIGEKEKHKAFLQERLTKYRHELDIPREPHQQEELSHLINLTVRKIGDLDTELKTLRA